ncbi:potassium channel family protein [Streptomyces sp. NPDC046831]|uniref:potassium channel family protein n=1 Tax=Streptomyces sp. NPDC046831 TaxID=3154805 RepID=UPI003409342A
MSDSPGTGAPDVPAPGARRHDGPPRPGRRAAVVSLLRAVLTTAGLVTAYYLLPMDRTRQPAAAVIVAFGMLAVVLVLAWEIRVIARSAHPRLRAVEALAATVPMFLLLFASAYYLLELESPGSFTEPLTRTDALYFALSTFTTVGYGDVAARTEPARVVTMLQMTGGLLLVGVAARVLAAAVERGLRLQEREPPG